MTQTILAFGASGKTAGLVTRALSERGAQVRGFVWTREDAAKARANGATEVAIGDLTDGDSVARALDGIERVFYVAPAFLPEEARVGTDLVAACQKAGVCRFVFSSVIHPVLAGLTNHAAKAPVEEAVLDSGLDYAFLHPTLFYQNFAGGWAKVVETGTYAEPWSPETRFSRVDYRDVAEVAAMALTGDDLLCGTYQLCAPGWLNRHDVAGLMGETLGRPVEVGTVDPSTLGEDAAPMRPMFEHYDRTGLRGNALTLRAILGREPRTLRAYFEDLNAAGKKS